MKNLIKSIKKLSPKKGDILVINTDYRIDEMGMRAITDCIKEVRLDEDVPCLILHTWGTRDTIELQRPTDGKHKVYLNNLEYLEYLSEKKSCLPNR
jgi:hypothetical protein